MITLLEVGDRYTDGPRVINIVRLKGCYVEYSWNTYEYQCSSYLPTFLTFLNNHHFRLEL